MTTKKFEFEGLYRIVTSPTVRDELVDFYDPYEVYTVDEREQAWHDLEKFMGEYGIRCLSLREVGLLLCPERSSRKYPAAVVVLPEFDEDLHELADISFVINVSKENSLFVFCYEAGNYRESSMEKNSGLLERTS